MTKAKSPQLELRSSEIRYRRLFEAARDGILILDAVSLKITDVNPFMMELLGYSRAEFLGKEIWQIGFFSDKDACQAVFKELQESGYIRYEDLPLKTRHGELREVEFVSNVYDEDGHQVIQCNIRDLTERARADETLRKQARILDLAPVLIRDLDGRILFWNTGAEQMYGWTPEQALRRDAHNLLRTEFPRPLEEIKAELLVNGHWEGEVVYTKRSGEPIVVASRWVLYKNDQGEPTAILEVNKDITKRKQAEDKIVQSESQLAEAQRLTHIGSWNWDLRANTFVWSDEHYKIFGLRPGEIEPAFQAVVAKYIHPDDRYSVRSVVENSLRTLAPFSVHYRAIRPDKDVRIIHWRGNVDGDAQGNPVRMFGTAQDVTELKEAENQQRQTNAQLENERRRLNNIVASVPGVVWEAWGKPDSATQRMNFVSDYILTMVGYSVEESLSTPNFWLSIVHPDDKAEAAKTAAAVFAAGKGGSQEFRWVAKNGHVVWVEANSAVIKDGNGRGVGMRGVNVDITERKKLEEQLNQAQKMEAIGTLAGGIAHDFNNILGAISGYSELAQQQMPSDSSAQPLLSQVLVATARATELVRQILTFGHQKEPERKPLQLQDIIYETIRMLQPVMPSTIEIQQEIDPATNSMLGDCIQIEQVIMNLCANAVWAMKEGGGILEIGLTTVSIDRAFARTHSEIQEGPYIRLTISDTGCGMSSAVTERIFEPFFTTKATSEGTGLGLAVVHGIIKNHGGTITVYSELEVGSTFNIYLPAYDGQAVAGAPKSVSPARGKGEHILFVDDEEVLVFVGRATLEHLGYRVTATTDSVEALATFKSQPGDFDLVVTDQTMPHLTGGDLAKAVLQIRPTMPVILTTGYSSVMSPEIAKAIGIRELLFKPTTSLAMGEAVARALSYKNE